MSTNNDGWILMSERKPTQFPVWLYDGEATDGFKTWMHCNGGCLASATHWKPAAADMPAPPREKTQRDKDADAWGAFVVNTGSTSTADAWHAALAYERAEVGKMLAPLYEPNLDAEKVLLAIRARCGGGK